MRAGKRPKTAAANGKPASGKLLSASTQLIQDEIPPGSLKARSLEDSSNKDDDYVRLSPVRTSKGPRIATANGKPASGKLSSVPTKLALGIGQDMRAKKVLTQKTG